MSAPAAPVPPATQGLFLAGWRYRHQSTFEEARHNVRVFLKDRLAVVGVVMLLTIIAVGILAPVIAPHPGQGRGDSHVATRFAGPSLAHPFGCDEQGRDVLSRVIYGARIPMVVSLFVIGGCILIGVPLGGIAGYFGGRIDELIMRVTDVFLAFPSLLLAIAFVAFLGPSLRNAVISLIISWWPWYTRLVRGVAVSLRERPFVEAAETLGVNRMVIVFRHIVPGAIGPVIVQATLDMGAVVLAAAALSFIGLGAQPPIAEWGLLISEGRAYVLQQWWISLFPALSMFAFVLAANLVGDGLRDVLDPRSKR